MTASDHPTIVLSNIKYKELKLLEDGEDLAIFYEDDNIKPGEEDLTLEFIEEDANTPEDIDAFLKDAEFDSNEV